MFFIYGTDAPIYHYPIVTSVMIVINVLIQSLVSITGYDVTPWILTFGDGFHPTQWLTHNFLHIGWIHLIGNMLFLFPFGLIVEGKIGWWRMLILYLAIGTFQGFSQQLIMLPSDPIDDAQSLVELFNDPDNPMDEETKDALTKQWRKDLMKEGYGSLGASAVVFGLLAVCAIWAPVNEFDVYFRWSPFISAPGGGEREWSVLTVCGIFVAKEFFMFLILGMAISSEALHLNGFLVGALVGLSTLYFGVVDCEGFDLISLGTGTRFVAKRTKARKRIERQREIEAAKPTGPPQAIVPKLAHQLHEELKAKRASTMTPSRAKPDPSAEASKAMPQQSSNRSPTIPSADSEAAASAPITGRSDDSSPAGKGLSQNSPLSSRAPGSIEFESDLPSFDDGSAPIDPLQSARGEIETLVAKHDFDQALRKLAERRRKHEGFVVAPASMAKLAEGLVKSSKIEPGIKLLRIASDAYPAYSAQWQIRIAGLELSANRDPIAAIRQLSKIDKDSLDSRLRQQYVKVAKLAKQMAGS